MEDDRSLMLGEPEGVPRGWGSEEEILKVVGDKARVEKGRVLVTEGNVGRVGRDSFILSSVVEGSNGQGYTVRVDCTASPCLTHCTCEDAKRRGGGRCKHVAGLLWMRLKEEEEGGAG